MIVVSRWHYDTSFLCLGPRDPRTRTLDLSAFEKELASRHLYGHVYLLPMLCVRDPMTHKRSVCRCYYVTEPPAAETTMSPYPHHCHKRATWAQTEHSFWDCTQLASCGFLLGTQIQSFYPLFKERFAYISTLGNMPFLMRHQLNRKLWKENRASSWKMTC